MTFRSQSRAQALLLRDGLVRTSAIRMSACGLTILGEVCDTCCVAVAVGRPPEKVKEFCSAVSYGVDASHSLLAVAAMATAYKGIMTTEAAAGEVVADRRRPRSGTSASRPATSTSTAPARAAR